MAPLGVASVLSLRRRCGLARIALEPLFDDVMIKLFGPKHPRQRLAMDELMLGAQTRWLQSRVEFVCFSPARAEDRVEMFKRFALQDGQTNRPRNSSRLTRLLF